MNPRHRDESAAILIVVCVIGSIALLAVWRLAQ